MQASTLITNIDPKGVAMLTLNRADKHNAFDDALIRELHQTLINLEQDPKVRIIVLTGAGESFSAGADLNWMQSMVSASTEDNEADALRLADLMRCLNYLQKPTIARINGSAFGGGLGLIACCDITIASRDARFGLTEAKLGLAPAVISPYVFRRIGETQARRYFLNAEIFDADQARNLGLIQEVVPADQLDEATEKQIRLLLKAGPQAVGYCKSLTFAIAGHDVNSQKQMDAMTAKLIAELRVSEEGQEGLSAFLQKRAASWT